MKRISYLFIASAIMLGACNGGFKKGESKSEYKIIEGSGGKKLEYGNFVEISFKTQVKDTVIQSSDLVGRQIFVLDSVGLPKMYFNVFKQSKVGDSVVIRMTTDSFYRGNIPPYTKKGQMVYNMFRIKAVYTSREQADSANSVNQKFAQEAQMKQMAELAKKDSLDAIPTMKADVKTISDYLAKNNIKATQAPLGTFVEIITPGTGPLLDTSVVAKVNYTGKTMAGVVFDSNVDTSFHHTDPYTIEIPQDIKTAGVIKGWIDGLKLLSKGSKARFYIPSPLGWGTHGSGEKIKPNDITIFDIEVVDVVSKVQAQKEAAEQQAKQQAMMEAMQKAQQQGQRPAGAPQK